VDLKGFAGSPELPGRLGGCGDLERFSRFERGKKMMPIFMAYPPEVEVTFMDGETLVEAYVIARGSEKATVTVEAFAKGGSTSVEFEASREKLLELSRMFKDAATAAETHENAGRFQ